VNSRHSAFRDFPAPLESAGMTGVLEPVYCLEEGPTASSWASCFVAKTGPVDRPLFDRRIDARIQAVDLGPERLGIIVACLRADAVEGQC